MITRLIAGFMLIGALLLGSWLLFGGATQTSSQPPSLEDFEARIPAFDSWTELNIFIQDTHQRLDRFAATSPGETISAMVTPRRGLTRRDLAALMSQYAVDAYYVRYSAGPVHGEFTITSDNTPATNEERLRSEGILLPDESLLVTSFLVSGSATDEAALSRDHRVALVDARRHIDRLAGLIPQDVSFFPQRSVFKDYQILGPLLPTPRPLSPPAEIR